MDEQRKPRAREKRVANEGKGVEKKGEGLGTGSVAPQNNRQEQRAQNRPVHQTQRPFSASRTDPAGMSSQNQRPSGSLNAQQYQRPSGNYTTHQSGRPSNGFPFQQTHTSQAQQNHQPSGGMPVGNSRRNSNSANSRPYSHRNQSSSGSSQDGSRSTGGGGSKLILIIAVLALLFGGGKLGGLFGDNGSSVPTGDSLISSVVQQNDTSSSSASLGGIGDLLSTLLGSSGNSVYDFDASSLLSSGSIYSSGGSSGSSQYFTTSSNGTSGPDLTVDAKARTKYTTVYGNNQDKITILVYMCGSDLESQNGMGTADLKEMAKADIGSNINLLVYTGGSRRWMNKVVSADKNQIYQIKNGGLYCLEENMGTASMTKASTLSEFIRYGTEKFPANRNCLIFWDHGGGSVSGYGYDEKAGRGVSMTLADINTALKSSGQTFDFIGFDACLMATVENALMLSQYADYMIASEETEPGVGWYYTNWLSKLSRNPGLPTVEIGKMIADDFVNVCNQQCRGQATTLSVVDLAELQVTVPNELKSFSIDTNEKIQNQAYKSVSSARSRTREFAQSSRIDQIDLVHFARNMGTEEGKKLADVIQKSVKYNLTGGGISNAYGLSIYFPYKQIGKVKQMVSTYQAIGMDEEYTRCIQEFASLEVSGQVASGSSPVNFGYSSGNTPSLMNSLLGGSSYSGYTSSYSGDSLTELLGGLFGGSSSGELSSLFTGRDMNAEKAAQYIAQNHFDPSALTWSNGRIELSADQWSMIQDLTLDVYYDDGNGFIDLGQDNLYTTDGNALLAEFDGTWISVDRQPIAYYYESTVEDGDHYVISGYSPALLNGQRVNLLIQFDDERPEGYIAGACAVYADDVAQTQPKNIIAIGKGDQLQFLCDYLDYEGNFRDNYRLGDPLILGDTVEIINTPIDRDRCRPTYCLSDIYHQLYWTPLFP